MLVNPPLRSCEVMFAESVKENNEIGCTALGAGGHVERACRGKMNR